MPMANKFPSPAELHALMRYEDGKLIWRERGNGKFDNQFAYKEAGCKKRSDGYSIVAWNKSGILVHRVVWTMFNRQLEKGEDIDHINGNRADNRIENLRLCSRTENLRNAQKRKDNQSGFKNVNWNALTNSWRVKFAVDGKSKCFGLYLDKDEAVEVSKIVRRCLHGQFANDGEHSAVVK
jgi:hypothetical protein